jgi:hypothetical protein
VQVPREAASEPLLSALKFTKGGKTYDLEEWIHRFDVTEEELREAIRRVMSYKGKAKYSIIANHFGVALPPPDPPELNEPFAAASSAAGRSCSSSGTPNAGSAISYELEGSSVSAILWEQLPAESFGSGTSAVSYVGRSAAAAAAQ